MFGHTLQDHERDSLIAPCRRWTDHLSDDENKALIAAILDAFEKWQLRQADANGRVKIVSGGTGLLSLPITETLVPLGDVEPWQCAGPFVRNDIDLAFKLWLDDDPDFAALLAAHRMSNVFAIVGLWSARTAAPDSLIRLSGLLVKVLIEEVNEWRRLVRSANDESNADKQRANANLARAREVASQEKTRKGDELRQSLRSAAFKYWCAQPLADKATVIDYLIKARIGHRSPKTIGRLIAGVKSEVKEHLKTVKPNLYALRSKPDA